MKTFSTRKALQLMKKDFVYHISRHDGTLWRYRIENGAVYTECLFHVNRKWATPIRYSYRSVHDFRTGMAGEAFFTKEELIKSL